MIEILNKNSIKTKSDIDSFSKMYYIKKKKIVNIYVLRFIVLYKNYIFIRKQINKNYFNI